MEKNVPGVTCLATALWIPGELGTKVVQALPKETEISAGQPGPGGEWLPDSLVPFQLPLCLGSSSSWLWSSGVHILQDREKGASAGLSCPTVTLWVAPWPCVKATAPPHRSHPSWGEAGQVVSLQSLPRSAVFCGSAQETVSAEDAQQNRRCQWTRRRRSPSRWTLLPAPALSLARVPPYWPPYLSLQRLTKPFPIRHWQRAPRLPGVSH